jgi:hypothetical protein
VSITRPTVGLRAGGKRPFEWKEQLMNAWIAVSTLAAALVGQSSEPPQWTDDYAVALAATKKTQRPLLVVIDDSQQPHPRLEHVSTTADTTQTTPLSGYQLCRIDAATEYGREVAESFKVRQYPYSAIIDRTGSVILHQQSGPITTQEWAATLARHRSGIYAAERQAAVARTQRFC